MRCFAQFGTIFQFENIKNIPGEVLLSTTLLKVTLLGCFTFCKLRKCCLIAHSITSRDQSIYLHYESIDWFSILQTHWSSIGY